MANASSLVSYEAAAARIGVLPSLAPRPNARNLRAMQKALTEALQGIPSYQSQRYGYMGFVTSPEEYALTGEPAWFNYADPGFHRDLGGTAATQRDKDVEYNVQKIIFQSQENVRQATNAAMTAAVPEIFRRGGGDMGPAIYTPTDSPGLILASLNRRYGTLTPAEKEQAATAWNATWNPAEPIETMFFHLEELYRQSVRAGIPHTSMQLLDKGLDNVKKTGLFITAVVEWNGFNDLNKSWNEFKAHFTEAYEARLDSGPTAATAGYHGAANALANDDDDDSLGSIAGSLAQMQMANNANAKIIHDSISGISTGTTELRQALLATQQQVAALARAINTPGTIPAWSPPPAAPTAAYPAYPVQPPPPPPYYAAYANAAAQGIPPPAPPAYVAVPPGFGGGRGRGGRGRGRRGRGRNGRGAGFQPHPPAYYQQAAGQPAAQSQGGIPPPAGRGGGRGGGRGTAPNPHKRYNNWNACFSCGFDVPGWHNSQTCPGPRLDGHQGGYTREKSQQYIDAGHEPAMRGAHKIHLPIPGTQWGE